MSIRSLYDRSESNKYLYTFYTSYALLYHAELAMPNQKITIFWSMPPDEQDWANLLLSGCRRVMLPFWLAAHRPDVLQKLAQQQKRVILRVEEDTIYEQDAPQKIRVALLGIRSVVAVDAVILGCEPDNPFNLGYGSAGWGADLGASRYNAGAWLFNTLAKHGEI